MSRFFERVRGVVRAQSNETTQGDSSNTDQCDECGDEAPSNGKGTSSRRQFLAWFGAGLTGVAAMAAGVPVVGALFSPVERREQVWHRVGDLDDFPVNETVKVEFEDPDPLPWAGPSARNAAWVRRLDEEAFTAFSIYCTHTGCPVNFTPGARLFICPCHGGVFDYEGAVVAGPPEEPLIRLDVRVRDEQVELLAAPVPVTGRRESRTRRRSAG